MSTKGFRYLFGPVASRRFGRSLGVDLLGQRVCSFDCVFCEAGPTQTCTTDRAVYVPTDVVLAELRAWLGAGGTADVITLAGRGEPTLHRQFGVVIDAIHGMCTMPVVLLSNGSLLSDEHVRRDAARADIVKISLSGWDDASLEAVNRPAKGMDFDSYLSGMVAFREVFKGELRLEVMFVDGVNTDEANVAQLADCVAKVGADKIELNTVVRPPADVTASAVTETELERYAGLFGPQAVVIGHPAVVEHSGFVDGGQAPSLREQILGLLARRGCTWDEMAEGLCCSQEHLQHCLQSLQDDGVVQEAASRPGFFQLVS